MEIVSVPLAGEAAISGAQDSRLLLIDVPMH